MIQITAVHMNRGESHQNILSFRWHDLDHEEETKESSLATMIKFLETRPDKVVIRDGNTAISVRIVNGTKRYIQTFENELWTNKLLTLPRF